MSKKLGNPVTGDCFTNMSKSVSKSNVVSHIDFQTDKNNNPVYNYKTKSGKKMSEPIRDDSIIGGYFNLGMMTTAEADRYTKAKQKENAAKAAKDKAQRARDYNPFAGFDDMINSEPSDDFSL